MRSQSRITLLAIAALLASILSRGSGQIRELLPPDVADARVVPDERVIQEVSRIALQVVGPVDVETEPPDLVQKLDRAKARYAELGAEANAAMAVIITRGLENDKKGDYRGELVPASSICSLIAAVRNDPALVPMLLVPIADWMAFVASETDPHPDGMVAIETARYLLKWGNREQQERLSEQVQLLIESKNPNLNNIGRTLRRIMDSPNPLQGGIYAPEKPLHEWCVEWMQHERRREQEILTEVPDYFEHQFGQKVAVLGTPVPKPSGVSVASSPAGMAALYHSTPAAEPRTPGVTERLLPTKVKGIWLWCAALVVLGWLAATIWKGRL
ncbi:MAG: hypothetical protein QOE70_885 [Chthoniobacter sp.]|nr:hypothetical protein [Chthoniobacter sp.]